MPQRSFDTIVVGSGASAYYCVDTLNKAGRKVAIVDERPFGGTCALRGCQPKKYLVANAEAVTSAEHLVGKGIVEKPRTDWAALQALKNEFLAGRSDRELEDWRESGVETFRGRAVMTAEDELTIGEDRLSAGQIVLATGAEPRRANIPGADLIKTSDDFLALPELPERIVFIGGGYISFEFAHVAARAGAKVTILHRSARPLKAFDSDLVDVVVAASEAAGIDIELNEAPVAVEATTEGLRIKGSTGKNYEANLIIEATGRVPNLSVLQGGAGNVESGSRGAAVNEFLQSVSNSRVYAIGDCAATSYMLAPVADEEGKVAARNILEGNRSTMDYSVVPSAVFTIPSLASVGLTESQAKEQGLNYRVNRGSPTSWPSSKRIGEEHAGFKVIIDKDTNRIIGAHLVRHNAAETINVLALAMKHGITASDLAGFMWAYPTMTSDLKYMVK